MNENILYTVLPFFNTKDKQWFRMTGTDYKLLELICPQNRLLPWQIRRTVRPNYLTSIKLVCAEDDASVEILAEIDSDEISYRTAGGFDFITYLAAQDLLSMLDCGYYYLQVTDGVETWYSEIFNVQDFVDDTLDDYLLYGVTDLEYITDGTEPIIV
jgi:hypothetical protein